METSNLLGNSSLYLSDIPHTEGVLERHCEVSVLMVRVLHQAEMFDPVLGCVFLHPGETECSLIKTLDRVAALSNKFSSTQTGWTTGLTSNHSSALKYKHLYVLNIIFKEENKITLSDYVDMITLL